MAYKRGGYGGYSKYIKLMPRIKKIRRGWVPRYGFSQRQAKGYVRSNLTGKQATRFIKKFKWLPRSGLKKATRKERIAIAQAYIPKLKKFDFKKTSKRMPVTKRERSWQTQEKQAVKKALIPDKYKKYFPADDRRTMYAVPNKDRVSRALYGDLKAASKMDYKKGQLKTLKHRMELLGANPKIKKNKSMLTRLMGVLTFGERVSKGQKIKAKRHGKISSLLSLPQTMLEARRGKWGGGFQSMHKLPKGTKWGEMIVKEYGKIMREVAPESAVNLFSKKFGLSKRQVRSIVKKIPLARRTMSPTARRYTRAITGFGEDIMRDPLTYVTASLGGVVKKAGGAAMKKSLFKKAIEATADDIASPAIRKAAPKLAAKLSFKMRKIPINDVSAKLAGRMGGKKLAQLALRGDMLVKPIGRRAAGKFGMKAPTVVKAGHSLLHPPSGYATSKIRRSLNKGVGIVRPIKNVSMMRAQGKLGRTVLPKMTMGDVPKNVTFGAARQARLGKAARGIQEHGLEGFKGSTVPKILPKAPVTKSIKRHMMQELKRTGGTSAQAGKILAKNLRYQLRFFEQAMTEVKPTTIGFGIGKAKVPLLKSKRMAIGVEKAKAKFIRPALNAITGEGWDMFKPWKETPPDVIAGSRSAKGLMAAMDEEAGAKIIKSLSNTSRKQRVALTKGIVHGQADDVVKQFDTKFQGEASTILKTARKSIDEMETMERGLGIDPKAITDYVSQVDELGEGFRGASKLGLKSTKHGVMPDVDIGTLLLHRTRAHHAAVGQAKFVKDVIKDWGVPKNFAPENFVKTASKYASGYRVPDYVGNAIDSSVKLMTNDADASKFLRNYDKLLNYWKGYATGAIPGFHVRNFQSDIFMWYLAGVSKDAMSSLPQALKISTLYHRSAGDVLKYLDDAGQIGKYSTAQAFELAKKHGVFGGGWISKEVPSKVSRQIGGGIMPRASRFSIAGYGRRFGMIREDSTRLAHFFGRLKQGMEPVEAAESVVKFHFNYDEITNVERKVFRRIIPFYTWMRKNIPLQFEQAVSVPGKYAAIAKGKRMLQTMAEPLTAEEKQFLPEWMEDLWAIKIPSGWGTTIMKIANKNLGLGIKDKDLEKPYYYNPNLPFQDINNALDFWNLAESVRKDGLSKMAFPLKPFLQLALNMDFFRGRELVPKYGSKMWRAPGYVEKMPTRIKKTVGARWNKDYGYWEMPISSVMFLNEVNPLLANIGRTLNKGDTRAASRTLSWMAGLKFIPLTDEAKLAEVSRQQEEMQIKSHDLTERLGRPLPPMPRKKPLYKTVGARFEPHTSTYKPEKGSGEVPMFKYNKDLPPAAITRKIKRKRLRISKGGKIRVYNR